MRVFRAGRWVAAAALLLGITGCTGMAEKLSTGFGLWDSVDPAAQPAPLPPITATVTPRIAWQASVGEAENFVFSPGIDAEEITVASHGGEISWLDRATGVLLWRAKTGQSFSGGAGAGGSLAVVSTLRGEILGFGGRGELKWKTEARSEVLAPAQVAEGLVVVRTTDSRLFAFDAADGKRKWVYQRANPPLTIRSTAGVVIYRGAVFAGFAGGKLVALNLGNGAVGWEAAVALPKGTTELERVTDITSAPVVDDRQVCAVAFQGRLACFEPRGGSLLWARDLSSYSGLAMDDRYVYVTDDRGGVQAFGRETGASVWKQDKLLNRRVTAPQVAGTLIAVGDLEGYVHFLSQEDGSFVGRIATDGSPIAAKPARFDNRLLVQTRKGGVFAIEVP